MNYTDYKEHRNRLKNRDFHVLNIRNVSNAKRPRSTGSVCKLFNSDIDKIEIYENIAVVSYRIFVGKKYIVTKIKLNMTMHMIDWSFDDEKLETQRIIYCVLSATPSYGLFPSLTETYLDGFFKKRNVIHVNSYADYDMLLSWSKDRSYIVYVINPVTYGMTLADA